MKKYFCIGIPAILLGLLLGVILSGCGGSNPPSNNPTATPVVTPTPTSRQTSTPSVTTTPTATTTGTVTPTPTTRPTSTPTATPTVTPTPTPTPPHPVGYSQSYTVNAVSFVMKFIPYGLTCPCDDNAVNGRTYYPTSITINECYWIAETTVTYELWSTVKSWATTTASPAYTFPLGNGTIGAGDSGSIQQPVGTISWRDAMIWCNALTEYYYGSSANCVYYTDAAYTTPIRSVDGSPLIDVAPGHQDNPYVKPNAKGFRLLKSNEWELAARYQNGTQWTPGNHVSGDTTSYCYPQDAGTSTVFGDYIWYTGNSVYPGETVYDTHPVKGKLPNALGLYDMDGNIVQLCFEWHPDHPNGARIGRGGSMTYQPYYNQLGFVDYRELNITSPNVDTGFRLGKSE